MVFVMMNDNGHHRLCEKTDLNSRNPSDTWSSLDESKEPKSLVSLN